MLSLSFSSKLEIVHKTFFSILSITLILKSQILTAFYLNLKLDIYDSNLIVSNILSRVLGAMLFWGDKLNHQASQNHNHWLANYFTEQIALKSSQT